MAIMKIKSVLVSRVLVGHVSGGPCVSSGLLRERWVVCEQRLAWRLGWEAVRHRQRGNIPVVELVAERALHVEVDRHEAVCDVRDSLRSSGRRCGLVW